MAMITAAPPAYRAPDWGVPAQQRAALRELVEEALAGFEPVAVTHDSDADIARRAREGFAVRDLYRPQLESYGTITPGEDLTDTAFAALQLRPRGSSAPVLGIPRYGDVVVEWTSAPLQRATITPILSGTVEQTEMFGRGLQAGTLADLPEILTDTLIAQHTNVPLGLGTREWLADLLATPHDAALDVIRAALTGDAFRRMAPEAVLRGATATSDAIASVQLLTPQTSAERDEVRAWAARSGIPLREPAPTPDQRGTAGVGASQP